MRTNNYTFYSTLSLFAIFFAGISLGQSSVKEIDDVDSVQIERLLENPACSKYVVAFYQGNFRASDDSITFNLLDAITDKDKDLFPLHFYTLNKIVRKADGALAEVMGEYCLKMVCNFPIETFEYFNNKREISLAYATYIGYELSFVENSTSKLEVSFDEFREFLVSRLDLKDKTIQKTLNSFLFAVKDEISKMNE